MSSQVPVERLADDRDHSNLRQRSVRGTAVTFAAQGVRFVVQSGSQILLANLLSPGDFGLVAMVAPVLYFVQIFNELGLMQATVQREEITRDQLEALFWVNLLISTLLAGLMMLCSPLVAWFYGEPRLVPVTIGLAFVLILSGLSAQHMALLTRRMQLLKLSLIDIACVLAAALVGLTSAWLGARYWSLVLMQAASAATIMVFSWVFSGLRPSRPRRGVRIGSLMQFGGNVAGHNLMTYAGYNLPSVLIGVLYNSVLLGLYDRSFRLIIVPLWQLNAPLDRVGTALLSRLRTSEAQFLKAYYLMVQLLLGLTAPGFVWAAVMSGILVPSMLGSAWVGAIPIVTWLAISVIPAPITMSTRWLFVSQGRSGEQLYYSAICNGLVVVSALIGVHWGPVGVAISAAAFAPLVQAISVWGATRQGAVTLAGLARAVYPLLLGAASAALLLRALTNGMIDLSLSPAMFLVLTLPLSYAVCAVTALVTPDGLRMLRNAWAVRSALKPARTPST